MGYQVGDIVKIREGIGAIEFIDRTGLCTIRMNEATTSGRYVVMPEANIYQLIYRQQVDTNTLKK